jgi:hypothetical protein
VIPMKRRVSPVYRLWMRSLLPRLPLLLLPLAGLALGCGMVDSLSGYSEAKELQTAGVPAQAEILSIAATNTYINDDPVVRLEVTVRPADGPAYQATIKRLLVSTLEIPQYQPGKVIAVRYDPKDPSRVSIDLGPPASAKTGEPFGDNFAALPLAGPTVAPPAAPALYRGTLDDAADRRALEESNYVEVGSSSFKGGAADPRQAAAQGRRVGAAVVVLYGEVLDTPEAALAPLPFRPRPPGDTAAGPPLADTGGAAATIGTLPPRSPSEHMATFWAKGKPPILGIVSRPLDEQEKANLERNDGIVVVLVTNNSPAAAARLLPGDIILAIDGKPILDSKAVPAFLSSVAGRQIHLDLLRHGSPLAVDVQLNPAAP